MQAEGDVVTYTYMNRLLWRSGSGGNPDARLVLQSDGNLVVYRSDNVAEWSRTTGLLPGVRGG